MKNTKMFRTFTSIVMLLCGAGCSIPHVNEVIVTSRQFTVQSEKNTLISTPQKSEMKSMPLRKERFFKAIHIPGLDEE